MVNSVLLRRIWSISFEILAEKLLRGKSEHRGYFFYCHKCIGEIILRHGNYSLYYSVYRRCSGNLFDYCREIFWTERGTACIEHCVVMTRIILLQIHHEFLEYKVVACCMQYRFRLCKIISVKHIEHQRFIAGLQQSLANRAEYFSGDYLSFKFITLFQIILYFQYKITRLYAPFSGYIS